MSELWVKLGNNRATQVSTNNCTDVFDFLEACKKKLEPDLDKVSVARLTLSTTEGGEAIRPGLPLTEILHLPGYSINDDLNPLFIHITPSPNQPDEESKTSKELIKN
ncbi:hypothetical protein HK103_004092, partial [Boothiomyces macroporosus]